MILDCGCNTLTSERCRLHASPWDIITCPECGYSKACRLWGSKKVVCESCGKGM